MDGAEGFGVRRRGISLLGSGAGGMPPGMKWNGAETLVWDGGGGPFD